MDIVSTDLTRISCSSSQTTFADSPPHSASTWDSARHSRFPSSVSSISSSSPTLRTSQDSFVLSKKPILEGLPEIDEDVHQDSLRPQSPPRIERTAYRWNHNAAKPRPTSFFQRAKTPPRDGYLSDYEGHWNKRRRSSDSPWNNFAAGMVERFPSFSKRTRQRKRASMSFLDDKFGSSPMPVPTQPLYRSGSQSRSLSRNSPVRDLEAQVEESEAEHVTQASVNGGFHVMEGHIITIMDDFAHDAALSNFEDTPEQLSGLGLGIENEGRSTTPILPPLMNHKPAKSLEITSPLQSPTIATHTPASSETHTPNVTPKHSTVVSPSVSARPSVASIHRSHCSAPTNTTPMQMPPLIMTDQNDIWAEKLGHANFDILPQPYVPDFCDEYSCQKLVADWGKARDEYAKHLSRTETHFGRSSRTFRLTEEKWAAIDAQWRINNDLATHKAIENGADHEPSPKEPAPLAKIPLIDDPRLLQSEDIPGPMKMEEPAQAHASNLTRRKSKRAQFLKLFGSFQFPSKTPTR